MHLLTAVIISIITGFCFTDVGFLKLITLILHSAFLFTPFAAIDEYEFRSQQEPGASYNRFGIADFNMTLDFQKVKLRIQKVHTCTLIQAKV
jgi:hypothetical protein